MQLSNPLMLSAMVLIGAGFTMRHTRFGRTGIMVLAAILLGFGVYFIRDFAEVLGRAGSCPQPSSHGRRRWRRSCWPWGSCCIRKMGSRTTIIGRARRLTAAALLAGTAWLVPALPAVAQGAPATLIADDIRFDQGSAAITARGGVEIFFEGARLRASSITYSRAGDQVTVEGPLTLIDPTGDAVIVADFAELSADLQNGVLQSARLVLDRQLQIAATQIDRVDGRYSQAYQAVASSCEVCFDNPTPLWEIRARRIIHDEQEQQLYFEGAQFRVLGVPVIWLPQMRLPDPTLERATGFLAPSIRATDTTGAQIRVPYFIALGDHRDLTLTPWIGLGDSQTIELRYRQAFRNGRIEATGSLTWDDLTEDDIRGHVFADGLFDIGRGIDLTFQIEGVTDDGYLTTYSFPDPDLLESNIRIGRTEVDRFFDVSVSNFVSLRDGDDNETLPTRVATGRFVQRFEPGGSAVWRSCASTRWAMCGPVRRPDRRGRRWPPMPRGFRRCSTGGGPMPCQTVSW
jgi:LPS-assembly protein